MLDSELEYRLRRLGMPARVARHQTGKIRDLYFPAAIVADEVFARPDSALGCACLGALGLNMTSTASTASLVGTGAQAGSMIMPGIGTAIGAAAGAAVAVLKSVFGSKDVRASGAQKGECTQYLNQYIAAANQAGVETTLGPQIGIKDLEQISWCYAAVNGGPVNNVDPRFFVIGWQQLSEFAKQLTKAAFSLKPGSRWTSTAITGRTADNKHADTRPPTAVTLPNPLTFGALAGICSTYMIASCANGNKSGAGCPAYWNNPIARRLAMDVCGYWINVQFPQVFAPPKVTATPAVVKAAATVVAKTGTTTIVNPATGKVVTVPIASPGLPTGYTHTGNPTVDAVGDQMADGGVNMNSPEAKGILADVAREGVIQTPAGPPSATQAGLGIGAAVVMGLLLLGGMKHGR